MLKNSDRRNVAAVLTIRSCGFRLACGGFGGSRRYQHHEDNGAAVQEASPGRHYRYDLRPRHA